MNRIPIYLVVGFLGSGKTTLLKRLVHAVENRRFIFVINEFSAVDVDAGQIEREGAVALAVAGGSIFCRCLITEFVEVMRKIAAGIAVGGGHERPDGVVIEASGMADPRTINRLLEESGLDREYRVAGITAVVDPGALVKLLMVLPNIKGQIQCADLIVFNKIDLHTPAMIDAVTEKVHAINPSARMLHCEQCEIDSALILENPGDEIRKLDADYNKCRDPHFEREELHFNNRPPIQELRENFDQGTEGLYRVKGCVECAEGWFLIDWSEGGLTCTSTTPRSSSCLTLIWNPDYEPPLLLHLAKKSLAPTVDRNS